MSDEMMMHFTLMDVVLRQYRPNILPFKTQFSDKTGSQCVRATVNVIVVRPFSLIRMFLSVVNDRGVAIWILLHLEIEKNTKSALRHVELEIQCKMEQK